MQDFYFFHTLSKLSQLLDILKKLSPKLRPISNVGLNNIWNKKSRAVPEDKPKLYVKLAYKNHVSRLLVSPLRGNRVK